VTFQIGDKVRWETDIDKVYSATTKTLVGAVGEVLPPQLYYDSPHPDAKTHFTPAGYYDVKFSYGGTYIKVGNIPASELVKVE
jgi:hypothetical protein